MEAFVQAKVISLGGTRSWTSKKGEEVTVQDAYCLIGNSPRPVQVSFSPSVGLKEGEAGMYACDLYPSRFEGGSISVTIKARAVAPARAAS